METIIFDTSATSPHAVEWYSINWKKINKYVTKLRQRIFHAEQLGQRRKVRKLQRLMLRSKTNLLLSIKRVTQLNKGRRTAGIDGFKVVSDSERVKLYKLLKDYNVKNVKPQPAKRTYIPKKNGKLRPLGIPVIKDRVYQNVVKNALGPQWESRFESTSYGFRPKRSAHDAIQQLYLKLRKGSKRQWVFEGDFKGCFDNLNHEYIMSCIENFQVKEVINKWLKAGYIDNNTFTETNEGTPQGGIISPLLANIALHGMENELGVEYFSKRDEKEFCKANILSRRKLAKKSQYVCRVCNQTLVGEETLQINQIVPQLIGGKDVYDNLELLYRSCNEQHQELLKRYGGGKELPWIEKFFKYRNINPSSPEGIRLMRNRIRKFKYKLLG